MNARLLSEYIVAVADRVARAPQSQPSDREYELFAEIEAAEAELFDLRKRVEKLEAVR